MADSVASPRDGRARRPSPPQDNDDPLASLRAIVVGPEQRQIAALQARLDDPIEHGRAVAAVLPQAFVARADDPDMARALAPSVERAITASVKRNPGPLADALFPVMGPAIRKAVAASLAAMVEGLNRTLEHSLSWRSVRWRVEALRTGRSFGEVVLLHTLVYRVEQLFLVDRRTGLLLLHVGAGTGVLKDADMMSGMLTAIRDFVQDSFRVSGDDSLASFQVGDLTVCVEQGPRASLAAVVRGSVPPDLRPLLQETIEAVHLRHGDALEAFDGDASALEAARPTLEACLRSKHRADGRPSRRWAWVALAIVALLAALWLADSWRDRRRWTAYVDSLRREPGIVVVSAGREGRTYVVSGLRDRLARDPGEILGHFPLAPGRVVGRWEPYLALEPAFVLTRARQALQPPPAVTLRLGNGVLTASGRAPLSWILEAQRLAPLVPGVVALDATPLLDEELRALTERVRAEAVHFERGTTSLAAGAEQVLSRLAADVRTLDTLAGAARRRLGIEVVGHADSDGPDESNVPLSRARAEVVRAGLGVDALPNLQVSITGAGSREPVTPGATESDKRGNRRVVLRIGALGAGPPQGRQP